MLQIYMFISPFEDVDDYIITLQSTNSENITLQ